MTPSKFASCISQRVPAEETLEAVSLARALPKDVNMRAVQRTAYGNPVDGLEYADIPEPDAPGPSQVLIGVEFSPINFSDLLVAQGIYPLRPTLPTVIGNEGVGRVLAVGRAVQNIKVGDRVLAPLGEDGHSGGWPFRSAP